jgi:hypothetical protein
MIMKCFKRNQSKVNPSTPRPEGRGLLGVDPERRFFTPPSKAGLGAAERVKPMVCPQKGSIPIKVSIFLLAVFIIFSMATVVIAQSQAVSQNPPATLEEERLITNYAFRDRVPNYYKELQNYTRDGCKKVLAGDWRWDTWGDIITITYNEQYKVFLGNVTRPVEMDLKPGHLLFEVYFPDPKDMNVGVQLPGKNENMDINWLRQQQQCRFAQFKGKEFSFDQITKKKTQMELWLFLNGDQLEYKVEHDAYYLKRIR